MVCEDAKRKVAAPSSRLGQGFDEARLMVVGEGAVNAFNVYVCPCMYSCVFGFVYVCAISVRFFF